MPYCNMLPSANVALPVVTRETTIYPAIFAYARDQGYAIVSELIQSFESASESFLVLEPSDG